MGKRNHPIRRIIGQTVNKIIEWVTRPIPKLVASLLIISWYFTYCSEKERIDPAVLGFILIVIITIISVIGYFNLKLEHQTKRPSH